MSDSQSFMERVVKLIIEGSLSELKQIVYGQFDINRSLLPGQMINPVPSITNTKVLHSISNPTMLILAVLCEQPDIVQFLLSHNPDLSIKVNGYNALHYSSLTKDTSCLKIFLTCAYYQKNISEPISEPYLFKETTNSLHIAVSNRNAASAFLLLNDLPQIVEYFIDNNKNTNDNNHENDNDVLEEDSDESDSEDSKAKSGIDVNSLTSNGSTPLHIAAYMRDLDMCRLLLTFSADTTIKDSKGRTASEIALGSHSKIGNKIAELLENLPDEIEIQNLKNQCNTLKNYLPNEDYNNFDQTKISTNEKSPSSNSSSDSSSSYSDSEENDKSSKKKKKKHKHKHKHRSDQKLMKLLISKIDQFNTRLGILEDTITSQIEKPPPVTGQVVSPHYCVGCHSTAVRMCPNCHHYFCVKCMNLPKIHSCI